MYGLKTPLLGNIPLFCFRMPAYFNIILIVITFLSSLAVFLQGRTDIYLRLFPFFLLLTGIVISITYYFYAHHENNMILYNFFTSFEFCFYFFILHRIINKSRAKKVIFYILCIYPLLALINIFFIQGTRSFHSMTYALGCLLVVSICVYYFLELFQLERFVNLARQPAFWICSGLLFFYACSFPIFGLANFISALPYVIIKNLSTIIDLLNIFLYSSFTIAFLCRLRTRKSMS
jgi:hypothetical protein